MKTRQPKRPHPICIPSAPIDGQIMQCFKAFIKPRLNKNSLFENAVGCAHHEDCGPAQTTATRDLADEQRAGTIKRWLEDKFAWIEDEGQWRRVEREDLAQDWRKEI